MLFRSSLFGHGLIVPQRPATDAEPARELSGSLMYTGDSPGDVMGSRHHVHIAASLVAHPLAPASKAAMDDRLRKDVACPAPPESKDRS